MGLNSDSARPGRMDATLREIFERMPQSPALTPYKKTALTQWISAISKDSTVI